MTNSDETLTKAKSSIQKPML